HVHGFAVRGEWHQEPLVSIDARVRMAGVAEDAKRGAPVHDPGMRFAPAFEQPAGIDILERLARGVALHGVRDPGPDQAISEPRRFLLDVDEAEVAPMLLEIEQVEIAARGHQSVAAQPLPDPQEVIELGPLEAERRIVAHAHFIDPWRVVLRLRGKSGHGQALPPDRGGYARTHTR